MNYTTKTQKEIREYQAMAARWKNARLKADRTGRLIHRFKAWRLGRKVQRMTIQQGGRVHE